MPISPGVVTGDDYRAAAMLQQTAFATVRRAMGEEADVTPADKAAGFVLEMVRE